MAVILPSVYKDGTATVAANGTAVTGQNTLWVNSVLPGDFWGVHKGLPIRIATVNSNTSLTLANPWPGAAQTAAAYEIMLQSDNARMQETSRQLLAALSSGNAYALSNLTSAADTLPYFTGAGTMATTAFAAYARQLLAGTGLLAETSLPDRIKSKSSYSANLNTATSGGWYAADINTLNTPVNGYFSVQVLPYLASETSCIQIAYGYGNNAQFTRTIQGSTISAWVAAGSSAVGSIVRQGNVLTGAIIERGSNANGEYTRFADGTQICTSMSISPQTTTMSVGSIFQSNIFNFTFPVAFSQAPQVSPSVQYVSGSAACWGALSRNSTVCDGRLFCPFNDGSSNLGYTAIGRWF